MLLRIIRKIEYAWTGWSCHLILHQIIVTNVQGLYVKINCWEIKGKFMFKFVDIPCLIIKYLC